MMPGAGLMGISSRLLLVLSLRYIYPVMMQFFNSSTVNSFRNGCCFQLWLRWVAQIWSCYSSNSIKLAFLSMRFVRIMFYMLMKTQSSPPKRVSISKLSWFSMLLRQLNLKSSSSSFGASPGKMSSIEVRTNCTSASS